MSSAKRLVPHRTNADRRARRNYTPGPGHYAAPSSVGRQTTSVRRSAPTSKFGTGSREGRQKIATPGGPTPTPKLQSPGPAAYSLGGAMAKQALSKNRSSAVFRYGKSKRADSDKLFEGFGVGKGDANLAARGRGVPGPGTYRPTSSPDKPRVKTTKFGSSGRENKTSTRLLQERSGSAPGAYDLPSSVTKQASSRNRSLPQYSFGRATRSVTPAAPGLDPGPSEKIVASMPGPGSYDGSSSLLRQSLSTAKSAPSSKFGSSSREQRAKTAAPDGPAPDTKDVIPAPGSYKLPGDVAAGNRQPISNKRSAPAFHFGTSERPDLA